MEKKIKGGVFKIVCLSVKGVNEEKKDKKQDKFVRRKKLDICALSEIKLKDRGEEWFGNYSDIVSVMSERVRAREDVAIIMKVEQ